MHLTRLRTSSKPQRPAKQPIDHQLPGVGKSWVVEYPKELFEVVDRNVMENDWMRSESSTGCVIVRVGVRWDEELGGFLFKEVLVNAE